MVAELVVNDPAAEPRLVGVASRVAGDGGWVELSGAISLGFTATPAAPTTIDLQLSGPAAGVELCIAGVELRPLTAR